MEGQLKEKKVRWKLFKRWRTRYFTLAGEQLLYAKSKIGIEVSHSWLGGTGSVG